MVFTETTRQHERYTKLRVHLNFKNVFQRVSQIFTLRCEQRSNDRIAAFKTARGCPAPTCLGKGNYNIVDSWKKPSNGAHLASLYGFAVSITLPDTAFDSDGGAVMLRKE